MKRIAIAIVASLALLTACSEAAPTAADKAAESVKAAGEAAKIAADFGGTVITEAEQHDYWWDVIINCTPVGMTPHVDASPIDSSLITKAATVFDLIYTPFETKLLHDAKMKGAKTISGVTMFIAQALAQERYWRGQEFDNEENMRGYTELITQALST